MGQWGPLSWQLLEALALSLEKGAAGFTHQPVRLPMAEGFPGGTNSLNLRPSTGSPWGPCSLREPCVQMQRFSSMPGKNKDMSINSVTDLSGQGLAQKASDIRTVPSVG